MKSESIKIETDRVKKVREHVGTTGQTISGFIALAIDESLKKYNRSIEENDKSLFTGGYATVRERGPEIPNHHLNDIPPFRQHSKFENVRVVDGGKLIDQFNKLKND